MTKEERTEEEKEIFNEVKEILPTTYIGTSKTHGKITSRSVLEKIGLNNPVLILNSEVRDTEQYKALKEKFDKEKVFNCAIAGFVRVSRIDGMKIKLIHLSSSSPLKTRHDKKQLFRIGWILTRLT